MIGSISNKAVLHRPAATRIGGRGAQGMSMIEVLVSVMVLGVGLLGIAAMQSIALRGGQGSLESSQAVMQTTSIAEAMRANRLNAGNYAMAMTCSAGSGGSLAQNDQAAWINALKSTMGVAGEISLIFCNVSSPVRPGIISSSSTRSNVCCRHWSMASVPLLTVITS